MVARKGNKGATGKKGENNAFCCCYFIFFGNVSISRLPFYFGLPLSAQSMQ